MKFSELVERVKRGEVTLELAGHRANNARERLIEQYERTAAGAAGENDGKWTPLDGATMEETNARMRAHYQQKLDAEVDDDDMLSGFLFDVEEQECRGCGQRLRWVLSGNVLGLRGFYDHELGDFKKHPPEFVCPHATFRPRTGRIAVRGKLLFANFFDEVEDGPKKDKYKPEWSLSSDKGQENITRYKAERNVAFGQLSNMSVGIFVSPDKKSIIVGDPYIAERLMEEMSEEEADKADEKALSVIEGHQLVGTICCDVWRWEATDQNTVKDIRKFRRDNKDRGYVELDVPHGVWEFAHYFHNDEPEDETVYARLNLVQ